MTTYLLTEAQRDSFIAIMRNNLQDPDAYDAITELQSLPEVQPTVTQSEPVAYSVGLGKYKAVDGVSIFPDGMAFYTSPQLTPIDQITAMKCAAICRSRARSIDKDGHNVGAVNEANKCAAAIESHWRTYPLTLITADDVTDEMVADYYNTPFNFGIDNRKNTIAAAYNAVIKGLAK